MENRELIKRGLQLKLFGHESFFCLRCNSSTSLHSKEGKKSFVSPYVFECVFRGAAWLSLRVSLSIAWFFLLNSRLPYSFIRWWFCVVLCFFSYFSSHFFPRFSFAMKPDFHWNLTTKKTLRQHYDFLLETEFVDSKLQLCRHLKTFQKLLFCIFDWISDQRL